MRQVVIEAPERLVWRQCRLPEPGPGEVRVSSRVVGICGSDLHAFAGRHPFISLPYMPGHEVTGTVDALGQGVDGWSVGDRALLEPNIACGKCWCCMTGRYNLCENLAVIGCTTAYGAMADAFTVRADRLHHVPDGISDAAAALVEPLSTATHAARLAGELVGSVVAVLGAGTIGLLMLRTVISAGVGSVGVTDLQVAKRDRALRLGADLAIDPAQPDALDQLRSSFGRRPDVVFDCVANEASMSQAIRLAERGGVVVVVGVPEEPVRIDLPIVQDREVSIRGSAMYVAVDVRRAMDLMISGSVDAEDIVTATFPLAEAEQGFAAARRGTEVKVQLRAE
jgi:2-desacetyl-2-hydroxyethyl bacteriochlorophyllide A dehydrogenase